MKLYQKSCALSLAWITQTQVSPVSISSRLDLDISETDLSLLMKLKTQGPPDLPTIDQSPADLLIQIEINKFINFFW